MPGRCTKLKRPRLLIVLLVFVCFISAPLEKEATFFSSVDKDATAVVYACVTSPQTYGNRGKWVQMTWSQAVEEPDRFLFVSNKMLPSMFSIDSEVWLNPENQTADWGGAQALFISVILSLPLKMGEWLMLIDDDAFAQVHSLKDLVNSLDPSLPALYGQIECSGNLCGGGGALLSPSLVRTIRSQGKIKSIDVRGEPYDVFLSRKMQELGLSMIHHEGFRGQPPSHYKNGYDHPLSQSPITFHYLDAEHQKRDNERYRCGACQEIYTEVYHEYYKIT